VLWKKNIPRRGKCKWIQFSLIMSQLTVFEAAAAAEAEAK